jgi:hypothetical protein
VLGVVDPEDQDEQKYNQRSDDKQYERHGSRHGDSNPGPFITRKTGLGHDTGYAHVLGGFPVAIGDA